MPTSYTSLLGLALPVTGELSGTWGDTVNDYITQYLDASVAGTQTISGSQTAVTLSKTTATSLSQAGSGATGSSQYNIINCTGNPASMLTVTVPAASKTYVVVNATSTNQDVKIVGAGPTTGVTLVAGEKAVIAWNGSDFIKIATSTADGVTTFSAGTTGFTPSTATSGAVTLAGTLATTNGGTGLTSFTANRVFYASSTSAIGQSANLTFDGTTLTAANITDSGLTSGRVVYATTGGNLTDSANLTFDGTTLTANALTTTSTVTINGGTANGVAYLNGSKVLTTGSALVFDGTSTAQISSGSAKLRLGLDASNQYLDIYRDSPTGGSIYNAAQSGGFGFHVWQVTGSEQMRLTSTGLGIGTSSPAYKLDVRGTGNQTIAVRTQTSGDAKLLLENAGSNAGSITYSRSLQSLLFSGQDATTHMTLDSAGNLGLGVTPSAWSSSVASQVGYGAALSSRSAGNTASDMTHGAYWNGTNWLYQYSSVGAARYQMTGANGGSTHAWFVSAGGTAGNAISFTQAMTLTAQGNELFVGTTSGFSSTTNRGNISVNGSSDSIVALGSNGTRRGYLYANPTQMNVGSDGILVFETGGIERARITSAGNLVIGQTTATSRLTVNSNMDITDGTINVRVSQSGGSALIGTTTNHPFFFMTNDTERARITSDGFTRPVAYADTVSALGNTGTATTINLQNANVFTATLTGNCTFTLSNPIATGSSSFTLILTNDGTAGRTVAWAGGSFVFPGGAASLSRTTTANAVDVWVFFTPNGGTTWYGNIAMKDMKA